MLFLIFISQLWSSTLDEKFQTLKVQTLKIKNVCDIQEHEERFQNKTIFVFEGAGGYSPYKYLLKKNLITFSLHQPDQIFSSCLKFFKNHECQKFLKLINPTEKENIANSIMLNAISDSHLPPSWYYFSQKHLDESMECAKNLNKLMNRSFQLIGYSMGATTSLQFATKLSNEIYISKALTVDPVPHGIHSIPNVVGNGDQIKFIRPNHVPLWLNYFQKTDELSMYLGIKGNNVIDADHNFDVSALFSPQDQKRGHTKIVELNFVKKAILNFLK